MSINFKGRNIEASVKYNAKVSYILPPYVLSTFPSLREERYSIAFAWAVVNAQLTLGFRAEQADGMLGYQTYTALLRHCNPLDSDYIVMDSCRIALPQRAEYSISSFDEPGGLDLHRFGKFSRRTSAPTAITLHHGGFNAQHCFNVFASDNRDVSSHFLIGKTAQDRVVVYQVLDLKHAAWHAGSVNSWTIGVDVCQSPNISHLAHYMVEHAGVYSVSKVKNVSGRGNNRVLSLDPVLARAAQLFVQDLANALSLGPLSAPPTHDVYPISALKNYTVFGHHHCNERKWDIAQWWSDVVPSCAVSPKTQSGRLPSDSEEDDESGGGV